MLILFCAYCLVSGIVLKSMVVRFGIVFQKLASFLLILINMAIALFLFT